CLTLAHSIYDHSSDQSACVCGYVARLSVQPGHDIVAKAVEAVANLSHRGAVAADGKSGDGSGVLTQIPRRLFARELERLHQIRLDDADPLGVGMFFLPPDHDTEQIIQAAISDQGLRLLGCRDVPIAPEQLGAAALSTLPRIRQALIVSSDVTRDREALEQRLYLARKVI